MLIKDPTRRLAAADAVLRAIDATNSAISGSGPLQVIGPTAATRLLPKLSTLSAAIVERTTPVPTPRGYRWLSVSAVALAAATLGTVASVAFIHRIERAPSVAAQLAAPRVAMPMQPRVATDSVAVPAQPVIATDPVATLALVHGSQPATQAIAIKPPQVLPRTGQRVRKPLADAHHVAAPQLPAESTPAESPMAAADLTELYVRVGGKLKALENSHGPVATEDLWPPFRRIHIQDAILDATRRTETEQLLQQIDALASQRGR